MSQQDFVSVKIPEADLAAILAAIATLQAKLLPHLKTISTQDKMEMAKMGDKSFALVVKGLEYTLKTPALVPPFLDIEAYQRDVAAVTLLRGLLQDLEVILRAVEDTLTVAGAEALQATLMFYNSSKQGAKANIPNAAVIYSDLSTRFPGTARKKAE